MIEKGSTLDIALQYASKGLNVIPIAYGDKRPILNNWVQECSIQPKKIISWFDDKQSNIGIVTGRVSNIIVIDIDTKGDLDGRLSIAKKEAELNCYLPPTVTAQTQSGGLHLFYRYPSGQNKITGHVGLLPQVDIRADGNQVVVYPSVGSKGDYKWITSPFDSSFAILPKAWKNFICGEEQDERIKIPRRPYRLPDFIPAGLRHSNLLSYACSLSVKGMGETEIAGAVREANRTVCEIPITDEVELENIINWAIEQKKNDNDEKDDTLPIWVNVNSKGKKTIDESNFVLWYRKEHDLLCINGMFYNEDGSINSNAIKQDVQTLISDYVETSLSGKVNSLVEALKNECFIEPPELLPDVINLENTSLRINEGGIYEIEPSFTLNRLKVKYNPNSVAPLWTSFLHQLLEDDDILTLQEFMGYCLIPTTVAQKALFLIGKGGEGKSVVGEVLQALMGNNMVQGEVHKLQDNRFMLAQLENKLVFYDDDLQSQALSDTGIFKKLVTASIPLLVERKGEPHYEMLPYARIIASGNKSIESCYDHSDGFYRRLILLQCKEKPLRTDDRLFAKRIIRHELEGILNWAIEGLQRLILNRWEFTISEKSQMLLEDAEEDSNSFLSFMRDENALVFDETCSISTKDLYEGYIEWCEENALKALAMRTVSKFLKDNTNTFDIKYSNKVAGSKRGYFGLRLTRKIEKQTTFKLVKNK